MRDSAVRACAICARKKKEYSALNGLISLGLAEEPHVFREWKPQRIWAQARKRVLGLARTRLPAVLLIGFSLVKKSCLVRVGRTEEDSSTCRDEDRSVCRDQRGASFTA